MGKDPPTPALRVGGAPGKCEKLSELSVLTLSYTVGAGQKRAWRSIRITTLMAGMARTLKRSR